MSSIVSRQIFTAALAALILSACSCSNMLSNSSKKNTDLCEPGQRRCDGVNIYQCSPDGKSELLLYECGSSYFSSECIDDGSGNARCSCNDTWDCPGGLSCESGLCIDGPCGSYSGPFSDSSISQEMAWGGTSNTSVEATGSPFPLSAQVTMVPLVINLTDDNGDGAINELDYPDIVYISYNGSSMTSDGILRAISGGGPDRGTDLFANCGGTLWQTGDELPTGISYSTAVLDPSSGLAAGDLDYDGVPEIVGFSETDSIIIYSNTGEVISTSASYSITTYGPAVSIANVDNQGYAEIVVGRFVFTLTKDIQGNLMILDRFQGD